MHQKTCTELRDAVRSKLVWLINLRRLDHTCAPNVPFGVDVTDLPYEKLRAIVIEACRIHKNAMAGHVENRFRQQIKLVDPIVVNGPDGERALPHGVARDSGAVRLSPDGRYLFVTRQRTFEPFFQTHTLQVYDLHDSGRCFWNLPTLGLLTSFDVSMGENGSLLLAIGDTDGDEREGVFDENEAF